MAYGNLTPLPQERLDFTSHPIWRGLQFALMPLGGVALLYDHLNGFYLNLDDTNSAVVRTTISSGRNWLWGGSTKDRQYLTDVDSAHPMSMGGVSAMTILSDHVWLGGGHSGKRIIDRSTGGNGTDGFSLLLHSSGSVNLRIDGSSVTAQGFTVLSSAHDLVLVNAWDDVANLAEYYINGTQLHSESSGGSGVTVPTTTSGFCVGNVATGTARAWNGVFRRIFVWNRLLSEREVREVSNRATWRQYAPPLVGLQTVPGWLYAAGGPPPAGGLVGAGLTEGLKLARGRLAA